jgi:hypothetical protein
MPRNMIRCNAFLHKCRGNALNLIDLQGSIHDIVIADNTLKLELSIGG